MQTTLRKIFHNKYNPFDKPSIKLKIELLNIDDFENDDTLDEYYKGYREELDDINSNEEHYYH